MKCKVKSCGREAKVFDLCQTHYMRLWATGNIKENKPIIRRIIGDDITRFWSKVDKNGPLWNGTNCWVWVGACSDDGYGRFMLDGKTVLSHRFAYELVKSKIPGRLQLDHLCRNHACVNPDHLEIVTNKINILRGNSPNAINSRKTMCKRGHPFSVENTYIRPDNGQRNCLICRKLARLEYYLKNKV
jgi:hypothetical protein